MKALMGIFGAALFAVSGVSNATLIAVDGWQIGDSRLTRDTDTGLDFLDLTVTRHMSVNQFFNNDGGLLALGFRMSTTTEVASLFISAGAVFSSDGIDSIGNFEPARELVFLLGSNLAEETGNSENLATEGLLFTPDGGLGYGFAAVHSFGGVSSGFIGVNMHTQSIDLDYNQGWNGLFLVRSTPTSDTFFTGVDPSPIRPVGVPEPSAFMLLVFGLIAVGVRQSKSTGVN